MIRLAMIVDSNAYETKSHFGFKLAEAVERQGAEVLFLDLSETKNFSWEEIKAFQSFKPDFSLSFNSFEADSKGKFFWDYLKTPHLSILLDPPIYSSQAFQSPYSLFCCIDESHVEWLKERGFSKTFFLPHGIEPELKTNPSNPRSLDVVYMASCYDPFAARQHPLFQTYKKQIESILARFKVENLSFEQMLAQELPDLSDRDLQEVTFVIDTIIRGEERLNLLNAIEHQQIHLFGGAAWDKSYGASDWKTLLSHKSNIIFHDSVSYKESLQILKQTKISLNTSSFFKQGSHERVFAALMAGALPFTSYTPWMNEQFDAGKELLLFKDFKSIEGELIELLADEPRRAQIALTGQSKVLNHHTWDNRAAQLLKQMTDLGGWTQLS